MVKGLLERIVQDHTVSVGITAAAFQQAGAGPAPLPSTGHLKTHADLRHAVALLLLAAEALPAQDVEFTVCRLLFGQASSALPGVGLLLSAVLQHTALPSSCPGPSAAAFMPKACCLSAEQDSCIKRIEAWRGSLPKLQQACLLEREASKCMTTRSWKKARGQT